MDLIDILWNYSQDQTLREMGAAHDTAQKRHSSHVQRLEEENRELRIRVGIMIRMLIERGVFSAEDYQATVKTTQAQLKVASTPQLPAKRTRSGARPPSSRKK